VESPADTVQGIWIEITHILRGRFDAVKAYSENAQRAPNFPKELEMWFILLLYWKNFTKAPQINQNGKGFSPSRAIRIF
jgi:hypothetical protein